jgi:hypothetical protein
MRQVIYIAKAIEVAVSAHGGVKGRKRGISKETVKYSHLGTIMEEMGILFIELVYK